MCLPSQHQCTPWAYAPCVPCIVYNYESALTNGFYSQSLGLAAKSVYIMSNISKHLLETDLFRIETGSMSEGEKIALAYKRARAIARAYGNTPCPGRISLPDPKITLHCLLNRFYSKRHCRSLPKILDLPPGSDQPCRHGRIHVDYHSVQSRCRDTSSLYWETARFARIDG